MSEQPPVVYLLHGDDEYAIAQFVAGLTAKLGDSATVEMNTTRLDGRSLSFDELLATVNALPFLSKRRLVVIANPLARLNTPAARREFKAFLAKVPPTTALVLIEYRRLTSEMDRRKGKLHWLEKWSLAAGERAFLKSFDALKQAQMLGWIQRRARDVGGQFSRAAAEELATLLGDDTRLADQEIRKLCQYVDFKRPVEADDVRLLTPFEGKIPDFALADALRGRDAQRALAVLHRQLEEDEPINILQGIVYQFRLLLLAADVLENGGLAQEAIGQLTSRLGIKDYPARLAVEQARRYNLATLKRIYRRLLEADEAIKTGKVEGGLALETLVTAFTMQPGH